MRRGAKLGRGGRLAIALAVPFVFLALSEAGLRLAGYGRPAELWVSVPGSRDVQTNRAFGRRFFPAGLARTPEPIRLAVPKPAGVYRIFVVGGSAAMGFPEPAFSFGRVLEVLLEERYPGTDFEVVNAAMTAINSHVTLPIVRDSAPYEPDAFVFYLGNNEVVGPYGPGTVFGNAPPSLALIRAAIWLRSMRVGQALSSALSPRPAQAPASWRGMEMFVERKVARDDPRLAAVYSAFAGNLRDMVASARAAQAQVALSTVAVNLRDLPPFASSDGPEGARATYEAARAAGDRAGFAEARDKDLLRFRADSPINEQIRSIAREGALAADAESAFAAASAQQTPGDEWFLEHVHLRFAGAWKLAVVTAEALSPALPDAVRAADTGVWLSLDEAAAELAYTAWDEQRIETQIHQMLRRPPFTLQPGNERRIAEHARMLEAIRRRATQEDAGAAYRQALGARPGDPSLTRRYAELLGAQGDWPQAVEQWSRLLQRLPDEPAWLMARGAALRAAGRMDDSIVDYEAALGEDPESAAAHFGLGATLQQMGDTARAEARYDEALALDPSYAEALSNIGLIRLQQGRGDEALARFDQAIEAAPDFADAHFHRAALLASQGRFEQAAPDFEAALRLNPRDGQAAAGVGAVRLARGDLEGATGAYAQAIELAPDNAEARFGLAKALNALGRQEEAIE
ncbi:MAG: tetratricopeptide repeat protein [Acidobacteria bacterium]|nr:tetratricopeptide repeat protein [Acidobacteriota bacterium]